MRHTHLLGVPVQPEGFLQWERLLLDGFCLFEGQWLRLMAYGKKNWITLIRNLLLASQRLTTIDKVSCCPSPLLWRLGDLLQPAAGLFQLRQCVGWWKRRHGWVLDERVPWVMTTGVDATANATAAPRVIPVGQRLGVQRTGLPQALGAVEDT